MTSDGRDLVPQEITIPSLSLVTNHLAPAPTHQMTFPDCPADCPPPTASEGPKELFRLVDNSPPTYADFLTCLELGKHAEEDACLRCAISTYNSLNNAIRLRKQVPFFRRQKIAVGIVPVGAGLMKRTRSSPGHWSWWPAKGYQRHATFGVVA